MGLLKRGCALTSLHLLWILCLPAAAYRRNTSDPVFKQCAKGSYYDAGLLEGSIGVYEIRLLDALQSHPRVDEAGNRLESYRSVYDKFQRVTNCVPWQTLVDRWHSHEEIKRIARDCLCTSIRSALVEKVNERCQSDIAAAPHGQLSATYLALGRRINVAKRLIIGLRGNATDLKQYDTLVDECFTQFFQRVGARLRLGRGTAAPPRATLTATGRQAGFPWFLVVLLIATAISCWLLFRHLHRQRQPLLRLPPPSMEPEAPIQQTIASTDGVAHPD